MTDVFASGDEQGQTCGNGQHADALVLLLRSFVVELLAFLLIDAMLFN